MANPPDYQLEALEQRLSKLLTDLRVTESEGSWQEVERVSQALANGLRVRDGPIDNHTILGRTALPQSLTSLLTLSLHGSTIPDEKFTTIAFEILRVAANICMDHDENRGHLLEAGFPQVLVSLLEGYSETVPPPPHIKPLDIPVSHLKIIRTAIGVLLNASIGFDPVKFRLISLEVSTTILRLSTAIYPPSSWSNRLIYNDIDGVASEDTWSMRCELANWAWRTISELRDIKDDTLQIFTPDVLPLLIPPLVAFLPPFTPKSDALFDLESTFAITLINADLEALEESCMLIESLSLDVEDIRLSLARGLHFPAEHSGVPCLSTILDFIENGTWPPLWESSTIADTDMKRKRKTFEICKGALIKTVVEVAGEESNEDVLWDDSEPSKPGGDFVYRMVDWLKRYVKDMGPAVVDSGQIQSIINRDDMVICASLALGNLARREKNSAALLSPPYSLAPVLTSPYLLSPSADIKVKHGVIGLLRHLSQSPARSYHIHNALGNAGVIQSISESGVWDEKIDTMADIVQLGAIGVVKHMCNAGVENTYTLILPSVQSPTSPTGLSQILALIKRSDSVPIKSEGSRVLVNVVKSLWSNNFPSSPTTNSSESPIATGSMNQENILEKQRKRNTAIRKVLTPECAWALASLIGRSGKYPLLVNEGVIALSLMSMQKEGGSLVLAAIMAPLSLDAPSTDPIPAGSELGSPVATTPPDRSSLHVPRHALDMLAFVLKNVDNPANFPVEVRINVCSLLSQLGKYASGEELVQVKAIVRPTIESLLVNTGGQVKEEMLEKALKRVLEVWS